MSKLFIMLFKTNVILRFFKNVFYRIQSNTVYIKTHLINSHISTSMYLVYRCDWSSGTKNLKDLEDHGDQYNRCFYVSEELR